MIPSYPSSAPMVARADSEVYVQHLLPKRRGFPLWLPQPHGNLPREYRKTGVDIGDVGIVTSQGIFDFLFNICRPSDHPINRNRVPDNFSPLERPHPDHIIPANVSYTHMASQSIEELTSSFGSQSQPRDYPADSNSGFSYRCSSSEGAILALPYEASTQDLRRVASFREYAVQNGENWYRYVNGPQGREAENGSLYLVTGFDKTKCWGVASFSNVSGSFSMTFAPGTREGGSANHEFFWQRTSFAATNSGPKPIEYFDGSQEPPQNQCTFIRGFKISLSQGLWAELMGRTAGVSTIVDAKPDDILSKNHFVPFVGGGSWLGRLVSSFGGQGSRGNQRASKGPGPAVDVGRAVAPSDDVIVVSDFQPTTHLYHPSNIINEYLLKQRPNARVAITHDNDWCAVIGEDENSVPNAAELLNRIHAMFDLNYENGAAFLVPSNSPLAQRGVIVPTIDTTNEHPSEVRFPRPGQQAMDQIKDSCDNTISSDTNRSSGAIRMGAVDPSLAYGSEKWGALLMREDFDVDGLLQSACSASSLFIPLYHSRPSFGSFGPRIVPSIVQGIIQQAELYFAAIGTTLEMANDGCTISDDALMLCQFLESGNCSITQLRAYLYSMIRIAALAWERSLAAKEQFRQIRRELDKICGDIPSQLVQIQAEQREREDVIPVGVDSSFVSMPTHFNSLPIDLDRKKTGHHQPEHPPEYHMKSFADVLVDLQRVSADLEQLIEHIGGFADWWQSTETKLLGLQSSISQLPLDGSNPLRNLNDRKRWMAIKVQYTYYSRGISYIHDLHPQVDQRRSTTTVTSKASRSGNRALDKYNIESNYQSPPSLESSYMPRHSSRKGSRSDLLDPALGKGAVYNGDHPGVSTGMQRLHESSHLMLNPRQFPNSSVSSFGHHLDIPDPPQEHQKGFRHFFRELFRPT